MPILAGDNREHNRSIALGCPLSPLLGGLHLADTDRAMSGWARRLGRLADWSGNPWYHTPAKDRGPVMSAVPPAILDLLHRQAGATVGLAIAGRPPLLAEGRDAALPLVGAGIPQGLVFAPVSAPPTAGARSRLARLACQRSRAMYNPGNAANPM